MLEVKLYGRKNCHLCEEVEALLVSLQNELPHQLVIIDVDSDALLQEHYGNRVPYVEVGPYHLRAPIGYQDLLITLKAAVDRLDDIQKMNLDSKCSKQSNQLTNADRLTFWITKHYMGIFNSLVAIYVGLAFLAPLLMRIGGEPPARIIYRLYGLVCHQLAFRSWFLFGEQAFYPLEEAGIQRVHTFSEVVNFDPYHYKDWLSAKNFIGNDLLGYKVALCQRDVAIYLGILLFGLLFVAMQRKIPPLPWQVWVVLGILPIGIDGISQLVSQQVMYFSNHLSVFESLNQIFPVRESTPLLRTVTGMLFGVMTAWFAYPLVEETMRDSQRILVARLIRTSSLVAKATH